MEDDSAECVRLQILGIIKSRYEKFSWNYFYASRRNVNRLSLMAEQDLDARVVKEVLDDCTSCWIHRVDRTMTG